jgi:hypothetical protein
MTPYWSNASSMLTTVKPRFEGLGSEQAIEWIAMVKRQRCDARDVPDLDWESIPESVKRGRSNWPSGLARASLPRLGLIAISRELATLNARTLPAASIPSRARWLRD